jgi:DNA-binding transcriptional ArsR family regulator
MLRPKVNINQVFHALGDPTRRAILEKLSERPLSVSGLAAPLDIALTAVVQHLQVLEESGLVHTEKVGRVYALAASTRQVFRSWSNGSPTAVRCGNEGWIGWASC